MFKSKELKMFEKYENVRLSGKYNMRDARAIKESKLKKDDYIFVMENYDGLKKQYDAINEGKQYD